MLVMMSYAVMVTRWMVMHAEDQILTGPKLLKAAYHDLQKDMTQGHGTIILIRTVRQSTNCELTCAIEPK